MDETAAWLRSLDEEEKRAEPAADATAMWLKNLDEAESKPVQPMESIEAGLPAWMQNIEQEESPAAEATVPASEVQEKPAWNPPVEEPAAMAESKLEDESVPSWLAELDKEEEKVVSAQADEDLPAWLRAEETAAATPEPTHPSDWKSVEEKQPEITYSPPLEETKQPEIIYSPPLEDVKEPEPVTPEEPQGQPVEIQAQPKVAPEPTPARAPYKEPVSRRTPAVSIAGTDQVLGLARNELSRSNIPSALESYAKLIKKGRFLDEVIYDLRDALDRYPVDVNILQSLGDAYMRANRLQDALDAYTKAEELLR
jgi:tetratricopeptide (TPR) repeat protein